MKTSTIKDLKGLKAVKLEIDARIKLAQQLEAARKAAAAKARAEKEFFIRAVGPIKPLPARHQPGSRASLPTPQPPPIAVQQQRDELAVMQEALSDGFDGEALLDSDDALSFRRPGMGPDVVRKLRRGGWVIQAQIDLHGLRRDEAREQLAEFLREAARQGLRCVRVIHGKGNGSPGKEPVLKLRVHSWLVQKAAVIAFTQARAAEGGSGALVVLLQPKPPGAQAGA